MLMFLLYAVVIYFALVGVFHTIFYKYYLGPALEQFQEMQRKKATS